MIIPAVKELAKFDSGRFKPFPLQVTAHSQTMVVGLEAGQAIPVHHPGGDLTMFVIEGRATLVGGDEELEKAGPGAALVVEAGQARGIHADVKTIALVVVSPPPGEADHREVMEHLKKGTWR